MLTHNRNQALKTINITITLSIALWEYPSFIFELSLTFHVTTCTTFADACLSMVVHIINKMTDTVKKLIWCMMLTLSQH